VSTPYDPNQGGQPPRPRPGPQPYGQAQPQDLQPPPAAPRGRGRALAAAAGAVVLIGGGVTTYVALSSGDGGGAASPRAAVQKLVTDLDNSDLVGLLDDLSPAERTAVSGPIKDALDSLKRNDILKPDADLSNVPGVTAKATNLTYAADTVTINDHVQIVQVTGGTITVSGTATKLPFTKDFIDTVSPEGVPSRTSTHTINLADTVRSTGRPIRVAAVKSGGRWYPSLLYSIADNVTTRAGIAPPTAADYIPADGASSPDAALRSFVDALLQADVRRAVELLSPDELGVVHDYGTEITDRLSYSKPGVHVEDLTLKDKPVAGGTGVEIKQVRLKVDGGGELSVTVDDHCLTMASAGRTKTLCTDTFADLISQESGTQLTARERTALGHLFNGLFRSGTTIVTTQSGGRWYLNPLQTYAGSLAGLLDGLRGDDAKVLLKLIRRG